MRKRGRFFRTKITVLCEKQTAVKIISKGSREKINLYCSTYFQLVIVSVLANISNTIHDYYYYYNALDLLAKNRQQLD